MDRTGYARGTLAVRAGLEEPVPSLDLVEWLTMADMMGTMGGSMAGMSHGLVGQPSMDGLNHGGMGAMSPAGMVGMKHGGMQGTNHAGLVRMDHGAMPVGASPDRRST